MTKEEKKNIENKYKPQDRDGGFPADMPYWKRRFFEILPGLFVWLLLLLPVIFALLRWNVAMVVYMSFLVTYWLFRTVKFILGLYIGVKRMEEEKATDWVGKIKELDSPEFKDLRYIYLCPVYAETLDILEPSFEAWADSDIGALKTLRNLRRNMEIDLAV